MGQHTSQVVVVTGARGALGFFVVQRFIEAGCRVIGIDQGSKRAPQEGVEWMDVDLTDARQVSERFPREADIVIHCAGGFRWTKVDGFKDEDLDFLLNTNLKSAFLVARAALSFMKKKNFGRLVFVGAKATLNPSIGMGLYTASKAGLNALTQSLAEEVKDFDINVNAVLPSIIDTPANRRDMPDADFSKWVSPKDLAEIIFNLTQPFGNTLNGALIPVSGRV